MIDINNKNSQYINEGVLFNENWCIFSVILR